MFGTPSIPVHNHQYYLGLTGSGWNVRNLISASVRVVWHVLSTHFISKLMKTTQYISSFPPTCERHDTPLPALFIQGNTVPDLRLNSVRFTRILLQTVVFSSRWRLPTCGFYILMRMQVHMWFVCGLKGQLSPKWKFCHYLLIFMSPQNRIDLILNRIEDILKIISVFLSMRSNVVGILFKFLQLWKSLVKYQSPHGNFHSPISIRGHSIQCHF